jgi:hypothetical protein
VSFHPASVRRHRREFGIPARIYLHARSSIVGNFNRADPVAVDVEQRLRSVEVTANKITLGLELHAIGHNLEDAGQFASAAFVVERRVISVDR